MNDKKKLLTPEDLDVKPKSTIMKGVDYIKTRIESTTKRLTSILYGVDSDFIERNKKGFNQIKDSLKEINDRYKEIVGDTPIEFLTKMNIENNKVSDRTSSVGKETVDLESVLNSNQLGLVNEIYAREQPRFRSYDDYQAIHKYIVQLARAVEVIVANVISPDDFTKVVFNIFYDGNELGSCNKDFSEKIKTLQRLYKTESKTSEWITDTLIFGDLFVSTIPYETGLNKMVITESVNPNHLLSESEVLIDDLEYKKLSEYFVESLSEEDKKKDPKELKKLKESINWKKVIAETLNNTFEFSESKDSFIGEHLLLEKEFSTLETDKKNISDIDIIEKRSDGSPNSKKGSKKGKSGDTTFGTGSYNNPPIDDDIKSKKKVDEMFTGLSGTFVKKLDRKKIVKIHSNGTCYGYYYFETEQQGYPHAYQYIVPHNTFEIKYSPDIINHTNDIKDPKTKLVVDIFAKNISKKLNKQVLENNKSFKAMIFELMKQDFISKKKVKVTYLRPEEVVHMMIKEREDGYGQSIFEDILFTAKLYLSVLICTLMMKISRSVDRRTYYVETGLSKDVEGIMYSFMRDIKAKDIKLTDFNTIDSIFNTIGRFDDYFIPVTQGQKAVEIDVTSGLQSTIDGDEFLEYLKKAMISGIGVPASFISYTDEMEFSRSVSMMNGMFLRKTVIYQGILGDPYSEFYRRLFYNEFIRGKENEFKKSSDINKEMVDNKENSKSTTSMIDYKRIEVKFPSPASLNMTNLTDQINSVTPIVEFLTNVLVGQDSQDVEKKQKFMKVVVKKYMPNIDWSYFENLLGEEEVRSIEDKLFDKINPPPGAEGGEEGSQLQ